LFCIFNACCEKKSIDHHQEKISKLVVASSSLQQEMGLLVTTAKSPEVESLKKLLLS
jgi:hypothetical protein